ncbi:hypothetical protein E4T39_08810 [Aureobasidium subglaciale]|nr:hypothetical protein E4T39_08810 [Aureobasidium subglaciale]
MRPASEPQRLLVFCDGTWCGPETDTRTNIQILAELTGIDMKNPRGSRELEDPARKLRAKYFNGIGLGSTFFAYLFNGATANDIGTTCVEIYQYIAQHYREGTEVWVFGLSRGAYTVRCVVGMINNCGIVKNPSRDLCDQVYRIYSSPYDADKPSSAQSKEFREKASWNVATPVKFMGLLDTVGSIGIPSLDAGNGPSYPTLWDQVVSSSVDKPCLTKRDRDNSKATPTIHETWFPGCHYDVGRQRFKFLRRRAVDPLERLLSVIPNLLSGTLEPNDVLADVVLRWMLQAINVEMPTQTAIRGIETHIERLELRIKSGADSTGSGDVYSPQKSLLYAPFGRIISLLPQPRVVYDAIAVLMALRDRRIPDEGAHVFPFEESFEGGKKSIKELGRVTKARYPSRTYESWQAWSAYFPQNDDPAFSNGDVQGNGKTERADEKQVGGSEQ